MASLSPLTFTISGSGFTPGGSVTINAYNSSGTSVFSTSTAASTEGYLGITLQAVIFEPFMGGSPGTYSGYLQTTDATTGIVSNRISVSMTYIVPTGLPPAPFYMGEGLVMTSPPGSTYVVFGAPLNQPESTLNSTPWNALASEPAIYNPTTNFDFSALTPPCEANIMLYDIPYSTNQQSQATTVTVTWRNPAGAAVFTISVNVPAAPIPPGDTYGYWEWYYVWSNVGYDQGATIPFTITGIGNPLTASNPTGGGKAGHIRKAHGFAPEGF